MDELKLHGRTEDNSYLLFQDAAGTEYRVEITTELRSQVLRVPPAGVGEDPAYQPASPRQIQELLRQGLSAGEVAEQTGSDLERVMRYHSPVAAEINLAVRTAMAARVGSEVDSPLMGESVIDRLAARGVNTDQITWSASRKPGDDWIISLSFVEGEDQHSAQWRSLPATRRVEALDALATQLTETVTKSPPVRSLFPPFSFPVPEQEVDASGDQEDTPITEILVAEQLVDQLNAQRGRRMPILEDFSDLDEDELLEEEPGTESADSDSAENADQLSMFPVISVAQEAAGTSEPLDDEPKPSSSRKPKRAQMPSWDEIVFGSRQD